MGKYLDGDSGYLFVDALRCLCQRRQASSLLLGPQERADYGKVEEGSERKLSIGQELDGEMAQSRSSQKL
jgi:hypothetical protein